MKNFIIILILVFVFSGAIFGQEYEWGEISDEELSMAAINEDPDADAVILFDIAEITTSLWGGVDYKRHVRIKILTEKGKDKANIKIYYPEWADFYELEAQSFLPNGDKFELDDDLVFEESEEIMRKKIFAIPGVEVESVFEYRYEIRRISIVSLRPWYFQSDIFTKLSQITVFVPSNLKYDAFRENTTNYDVEFIQPDGLSRKSKYIWRGKNLPAIKPEPYMTNIRDYTAKLNFQLMSFSDYFGEQTILKTWDDLAKIARDRHTKLLDMDEGVTELNDSLITDSLQAEDKIKILYDFVRKNIETAFTDEYEPPEKLLENKRGDRVEKNLLLLSMLRNAGFEAYPVLISSRKNGKFSPRIIQLRQFNYTIICVLSGKDKIFLDTSDKYCPFGMLPVDSDVGKGLIINNDNGKIINIPKSKHENQSQIKSISQVKEDGTLYIKSNFNLEGMLALEERITIRESEQIEYIKDLVDSNFFNARIDTFNISNISEIEKPLEIFVKFHVKEYGKIIGNMIYIQPPYWNSFKNNPFISDQRFFPVDFPYIKNSTQQVDLYYPSSYKIGELPSKSRAIFSKMSYSSNLIKHIHKIEINRIYKRGRKNVHHSEYNDLKNFYDKVVESDQSQIVLQKQL